MVEEPSEMGLSVGDERDTDLQQFRGAGRRTRESFEERLKAVPMIGECVEVVKSTLLIMSLMFSIGTSNASVPFTRQAISNNTRSSDITTTF